MVIFPSMSWIIIASLELYITTTKHLIACSGMLNDTLFSVVCIPIFYPTSLFHREVLENQPDSFYHRSLWRKIPPFQRVAMPIGAFHPRREHSIWCPLAAIELAA